MGYDVVSSAQITIPADKIDPIWAAFCAEGSGVDITDVEDRGGVASKVASAIVSSLGGEGDFHGVPADPVVLHLWAEGRTYDADSALSIVAANGGAGIVEAVGEDHDQWRWLLVDNALRVEAGYIVYQGEVDTAGWIAQLQFFDDSGFDHVAVLPSEAGARAQIAAWCRADYLECGSEVTHSVTIADTDDDETVIARWTEILGGTHYRVIPVAESVR